jgi:RNA polymerase subunit RPABC4/transcription elongation factor Spt4
MPPYTHRPGRDISVRPLAALAKRSIAGIMAFTSAGGNGMELPANLQSIISLALLLLGAYGILFLIALVLWTIRDIRSRSRDILVQILATLLVLVFNIPGLMLYFVLRPRYTLDEAYEHALGQEAMLQDIEERYICPSCRRKAEADFLLCPHCHAQLRKQCSQCERLINLHWGVCPYCGQEQPEAEGEPELAPTEEESELPSKELTAFQEPLEPAIEQQTESAEE